MPDKANASSEPLAPYRDLPEYAALRDDLLARTVQVLADDARVDAVWLSGSFGRGEEDEWADFDLHVAIRDDAYDEFVSDRGALYDSIGTPILIQHSMPSDSMPGGLFELVYFEHALEIDWNFGPSSKAVYPLAYKSLLVERVSIPTIAPSPLTAEQRRAQAERWLTFFWAMAPIASKFAGRGDTRRAVKQIDLLSEAFIALHRLSTEAHGSDPHLHATNRVLEPEIDARLPRVGYRIDALSALAVAGQLCREVELLHAALRSLGVAIPEAMPRELERLALLAATTAPQNAESQRVYR